MKLSKQLQLMKSSNTWTVDMSQDVKLAGESSTLIYIIGIRQSCDCFSKMILRDSQSLTEAIEQEGVKATMFTKWMEMNVENKEARSLTYAEFPTKFVWNGKEWTKRKRCRTIGRITYTRVPCSSSSLTLCNLTSPSHRHPSPAGNTGKAWGFLPIFLFLNPEIPPPFYWKFQICFALSSSPAALACGCDFRSFLVRSSHEFTSLALNCLGFTVITLGSFNFCKPRELSLQIAAGFYPLLGPILQLLNSGMMATSLSPKLPI
ncbi:hypothetical protein SLEP1_g22147 [Rubroshorea leprosula]|uniref:Uncharacterized protein n=1 Tax=Rubroshorea leprosula TaxID=152421 RepID=A0AAV5JDM2_9ROSI|nr:hypothetical protein SLEP1_g22147 [Rubroshorea leprosula]